MDSNRREHVRLRAGNRCEYCRLRQEHDSYHPFHVEHIIAKQHRGNDELENLAWSCHHCNLYKGPNLSGLDPDTNELIRLFHPRRDNWYQHFVLNGPFIAGLTAVGRTTAWLLQMNSEERVELRNILIELGELD